MEHLLTCSNLKLKESVQSGFKFQYFNVGLFLKLQGKRMRARDLTSLTYQTRRRFWRVEVIDIRPLWCITRKLSAYDLGRVSNAQLECPWEGKIDASAIMMSWIFLSAVPLLAMSTLSPAHTLTMLGIEHKSGEGLKYWGRIHGTYQACQQSLWTFFFRVSGRLDWCKILSWVLWRQLVIYFTHEELKMSHRAASKHNDIWHHYI